MTWSILIATVNLLACTKQQLLKQRHSMSVDSCAYRWDGRGVESIAHSRYEPSNDEMRQAESAALERRADYHDRRTKENCLPSSKNVADPDASYRTAEAPQIIRCDGYALDCGPVVGLTRAESL